MKSEYDFFQAKKGKFYHADATFIISFTLKKMLSRFYKKLPKIKILIYKF